MTSPLRAVRRRGLFDWVGCRAGGLLQPLRGVSMALVAIRGRALRVVSDEFH
jgi:hypothetical protein